MGGGGEEREKAREGERDEGEGESLLLTYMHIYTPETLKLPSPTTRTSRPWGKNSNWRGWYI